MSATSKHFGEMLLDRLDSKEHKDLLESIDTYTTAQQQLNEVESLIPENVRKAIFEANRVMHDVELQVIYRTGIQDGIKLSSQNFITEGL
jgi:hypothetical protein